MLALIRSDIDKAEPETAPRKKLAAFSGEFCLISLGFCLICLIQSYLAFALDFPIGPNSVFYAIACLMVFLTMRIHRFGEARWRLVVLLCVALVFALAVGVSSSIFDTSWDGMAYHEVSVIALKSGWNPVYAPHVVNWLNATFPEKRIFVQTIANNGIWTDHYPKAAWILGAMVVTATNLLDTSKWLHIFLAVTAMLAIYRGFALVGVPRKAAVTLAMVAALSPVTIAQGGTNYVDGLMASTLIIQLGATISWIKTKKPEDLFVMMTAIIIASNLKFTGIVYSFAILLIFISALLFYRRKFSRYEIITSACCAVAFFIVSSQTYLLNIFEQGHPFYPINKIDVMNTMMPDQFLKIGRIHKFLISTFSIPSNASDQIPALGLFWPRLWHYNLIMSSPDTRIDGFGDLFGWSLIAAFGGSIFYLRSVVFKNKLKTDDFLLVVMLVSVLASAFVNPEFWWARYAPQLWLIPILVSSLLGIRGYNYASIAVAAPALFGSIICLIFWIGNTVAEQRRVDEILNRIAAAGHSELRDSGVIDYGAFTFAYYQQTKKIDVRFATNLSECPDIVHIGIVSVCLRRR